MSITVVAGAFGALSEYLNKRSLYRRRKKLLNYHHFEYDDFLMEGGDDGCDEGKFALHFLRYVIKSGGVDTR